MQEFTEQDRQLAYSWGAPGFELDSGPVADKVAIHEALDERREREERGAREEIRGAFCQVGIVPAVSIALPYVDGTKQRVCTQTMREAILDLIQGGDVDDELIALIEAGDSVDMAAKQFALRDKLRDKYLEAHAADVAVYRL